MDGSSDTIQLKDFDPTGIDGTSVIQTLTFADGSHYAMADLFSASGFVRGTSGDDTIQTGPSDDVIDPGQGNDVVSAANGDDMLYGGDGNDILNGGAGNDYLDGGTGHDSLFGGTGGTGNNVLLGDERDDWTPSGLDRGTVDGQDYIVAGPGNDALGCGGGDDVLLGGDGNNQIWGDALVEGVGSVGSGGTRGTIALVGVLHLGNDFLDGGAGNDMLYGDGGHDTLYGGTGDDVLYGDTEDEVWREARHYATLV